jgi:ribosomal RNA assembly protein
MASTSSTEEFAYELRIPVERVAVLIGKKGEVKRALEQATKTKLEIDSTEGEVRITGTDAVLLYMCREVVRAISRGFNPEVAWLMLKQDYGFELINLADYARSPKDLERLKGRVIGEGGKARRTIEELTQTNICVYGKTIGIIGPIEYIVDARRAIEALLGGAQHATVYRMLERRRRERRVQEI